MTPPDPKPAATAQDNAERRRLQMADIARLAGVSVSTVSRALNGSSLVNQATRERIAQLAQSLHYTINQSAKNLRLQENRTVAVVIPWDRKSSQPFSDPFLLSMVGRLADVLTERGFDMLLARADADHLPSITRHYDTGVAMGIIQIGQDQHHQHLNQLAARHMPIVVWGAQMPQQLYCTVGGDNEQGGRLAAEHLLSLGRRRIVFMGDAVLPEMAQRHAGYLSALRAAGVQPGPLLELATPFASEAAYQAMQILWRQHPGGFDGVVACSDLLALSAVQALRDSGCTVPEQVSVTGYDNIPLAAHSNPTLTTIDQPVDQAGTALVDALQELLQTGQASPRAVPVRLVVRGSTCAAA